jgi:hypothetical protein
VDDRVCPVDKLELVVVPRRPLGALVLAVADLDGIARERLDRVFSLEDELDHLPVALVLVVEVVEGVEEPVLERQPARHAGVCRDVGVDRRPTCRSDPIGPELVIAARVEGVPGEVQVVLVEPLPQVCTCWPHLDQVTAAPRAA